MKFILLSIIASVSALEPVPVGSYDRCALSADGDAHPRYFPKSCPATDCCSTAVASV